MADFVLPTVTQISAGANHTCALDDAGVHCWGNDFSGETTVPALSNPTAVSAGGFHTCALDDNGVVCWGSNSYGQTTVPALTNPSAVSAGIAHTCALDATDVHCWGDNSQGQTTVPTLSNPTMVSAGYRSSCALDDTGVHCWGAVSATIPTLSNPTAISTGYDLTCALDDDGVHCWKNGGGNQITIPALSNPTAVSVSLYRACAVDATGVVCWYESGLYSHTQTTVPALRNPTMVSVGTSHACALDDTGVVCWGSNAYGKATVPAPVAPKPLDNCPHLSYWSQLDTDGDGLGDVCDPLPADGDNLNVVNNGVKAERFGSVVAYVGDFDGDHFGDWAVGNPRYAFGSLKGIGQVKIISGNNGSVLAEVKGNVAGDGFGTALAGNADVNGDGFMDVVVGAPNADELVLYQRKDLGAVTVIYGCAGENCATTASRFGSVPKTGFGSAVALGDYDADGKADVMVGEPKATNNSGLKQAGKVTVLSGANLAGWPLDSMGGRTAGALAGTAVAAVDFNSDGRSEMVMGALKEDTFGGIKDAGSVYIFGNANYYQEGAAAKDAFGQALAVADVNGDGYMDVVVGAPGLDNPSDKKLKDVGGFVVLYGGSNNNAYSRSADVLGTEPKSGMGSSVAVADVNADGYADIIVGAPKGDSPTVPKVTKDTGSVQVFSGNGFAPLGSTQYGTAKGDAFGTSVSAGDINADGKADIIVGIPGKDVMVGGKLQKDAGGITILNATAL